MAIMLKDGKILLVGGKIAVSPDCCCGDSCCAGCSGDSGNIASLLIDVDASAAEANEAETVVPPCDDAGCQELTGIYTLTPGEGEPPGATCSDIADTSDGALSCVTDTAPFDDPPCIWIYNDPDGTEGICEDGLPQYQRGWKFLVSQADDGHYYAMLSLTLTTDPATGIPTAGFVWIKDLGTTQPDCSTLFPLTFDSDDYCTDETPENCVEFMGELICTPIDFPFPCFYGGISITVDLP